MKKMLITAGLAAFLTVPAHAFDPMSVYTQKSPENCLPKVNVKGKMGLNDLIQIGVCNNPDLNRTFMAVRSAEAELGASKAAYLPNVALTAAATTSHSKGQYDLPDANVYKDMTAKPYSINVALNWLLLDFGGRSATTDMMKAYMEQAAFGYNAALHDLVLGVHSAYMDLLSAKEVLKSAETSVASYKKSYDETQKKYQVGKAATSDLLLAKTTYLRSKLAVTAAQNTIEKNQANLATLLNLPPETKFSLVVPKKDDGSTALAEKMPVQKMIKLALDLRPEIKGAAKSKAAAKAGVSNAKSAMAPTLALTANASYADRWRDDKPFKDGYPCTYGGDVGVVLNVPLFEGFSKSYALAKARYDYRQAVWQEKSTEDAVKNEVWSAYQDYKTALASYTINQDVLKSAEENERVSRASYRAGKETLLNLLTVQAQLATARQELITSFYTVLVGKSNLYRAIGKF